MLPVPLLLPIGAAGGMCRSVGVESRVGLGES